MRDDAGEWFRAFHGRAPAVVAEAVAVPRWLADLGPLVSVSYLRETAAGPELREHLFSPGSAPVLARTDSGALAVVGGRYSTGKRGIMDQGLARVDGRGGGRSMAARVTPQGVPVYGRQTPREVVLVRRANPLELVDMKEGGRRVADALVTGGTALVAMGLSDMIVERTTWPESGRALAQGLGLALPGAVLCFTDADAVGAGLVAGGIASAGLRVARARQWERVVAGWIQRMMPGRAAGAAADAGAVLWGDEGGAEVRVEAAANG